MTNDTKKVFWKKGMCSTTFYYLLNRELKNNNELYERGSDPLVGGIMQLGHQCGLLFGSALAVGNESYRRFKDKDQATAMAIIATGKVSDAFEKNAGSVNCRKITETDMHNKLQFAKYMIFKARSCFTLADRWTRDAFISAKDGLSSQPPALKGRPVSCASEVVRRLGGNEEEQMIVAGFAGGLGLSGEACGALSAAIWYRSVQWAKEHPDKSAFNNEYASNIVFTFDEKTGSKYLCREICGMKFHSIDEHTEYIKNGGCRKIIDALSNSV